MKINTAKKITLVEVLKEEKQSASGLMLDGLEEESIVAYGRVVSSKVYDEGCVILYNKIAPFDVNLGDKKYFAVPNDAIIGSVEFDKDEPNPFK